MSKKLHRFIVDDCSVAIQNEHGNLELIEWTLDKELALELADWIKATFDD